MGFLARRSGRGPLPALVLAMTALVISINFGATAYAGVVTTGSVLKTAKAAIAQQSGVQVSIRTSTTDQIIADVGTTSGAETIIEGKADLAVRVTPTEGYISGNFSGLTKIFGLSSAEAKRVGADWMSWKAGTSEYSGLKSGLTISGITALLPKTKGTKLSTDSTNGTELYVLKWSTTATSSKPKLSITLTISATGPALPVEQTETTSGGTEETTTLSMWGEPVLVGAPPVGSTIASSRIKG